MYLCREMSDVLNEIAVSGDDDDNDKYLFKSKAEKVINIITSHMLHSTSDSSRCSSNGRQDNIFFFFLQF